MLSNVLPSTICNYNLILKLHIQGMYVSLLSRFVAVSADFGNIYSLVTQ